MCEAGQPGLEPGIAGFGDGALSSLATAPCRDSRCRADWFRRPIGDGINTVTNAGGGTRTPTVLDHEDLTSRVCQFRHARVRTAQSDLAQVRVSPMADTVLVHPNWDKAESKATKAIVILLLLVSAALILIVTVGGWSKRRARRSSRSPTSSSTWSWPSMWLAGTAACCPWRRGGAGDPVRR